MVRVQNLCRSVIRADSPSAGTFRVLLGVFRPKIAAEKLLSLAIYPFPRTGNVIGVHLFRNPIPFRTYLNLHAWTIAEFPLHPYIVNPANA